ncbi:MAG TPA: ribbon-helix-helix protein, CopG family [Terriglobales bacterium]|nr:ribbon-helix-helix protein, CopG family [Terriglobales bacterium]
MVKVTYTLDDETVERIRRIAGRLGKPQSMVVREAVKDYEARSDKLSEEERTRLLAALDAAMAKLTPRPRSEIDAELAEIRRARRHGGRRHRAE